MMAARCSADARRARIVAEARRWVGTPYAHQASCPGAGCDCLGLLRGVWRAVIGREPEAPPPYTPDWSEAGREERLLAAARRHLIERRDGATAAGDVLLFRMRRSAPAKHLAILSECGPDDARMVHAYTGAGVCESPLGPSWARRIAAVFSFPGV